jgi:hypothetical protein
MWRDAPPAYGPQKTLYNRFVRWSRMGAFNRIFAGLAAGGGAPDQLIGCHPPQGAPHRRIAPPKRAVPRRIGRTKGGLTSKLHAVCDEQDRPRILPLTEC